MSEDLKKMLEDAYLMGFRASNARYNADRYCWNELEDKKFVELRDEVVAEILNGKEV
jgi:hypothetical protein